MQVHTMSNEPIAIEEFQIDYNELIDSQETESEISDEEEQNIQSKQYNMRISLPPDNSHHNQITNELFQITNRESWTKSNTSILFNSSPLKNDKINKMMQNITKEKQRILEQQDYELDDVVRVGFYRGNITKRQFNVDNNEAIDTHLSNYLGPFKRSNQENKENKENLPYPDSLKAKNSSNITKPKPRNSNIPILKPIHANTNKSKQFESFLRNNLKSPNRICSPKSSIVPGKSVLKNNINSSTFLIESSSGLINEATKFGTELNTGNCEGFPFPETESETVQIPTNEDNVNKMAIIRMIKSKSDPTRRKSSVYESRTGFYNESEFQDYKQSRTTDNEGIKVVSQSIDTIQSSSKTQHNKKSVKWANNLEW